ncbi:MAG: hypothetical protein JXQ23_10845 [Clostridia bacterium]|nr:hypothetical protein [Clostridia bacterium]
MKVKIKRVKDELGIEYYNTRDKHQLRYGVLMSFINEMKENACIIIDTNNQIKDVPLIDFQEILNSLNVSYLIEKTKKESMRVFGLAIETKNSTESLKENLIIIKVSKPDSCRKLYDELLRFYDYGIGLDSLKTMDEIMEKLRLNISEVLFHDDILPICFYDSITIGHIRIGFCNHELEKTIREIIC